MSDYEKTVHFINLMHEWIIWNMGADGDDIILWIDQKDTAVLQAPNYLYDKKWFELAWRVLNWGMGQGYPMGDAIAESLTEGPGFYGVFEMPPADAQRAWLDKILALAIEAGMVTE